MDQVLDRIIDCLDIKMPKNGGDLKYQGSKKLSPDALIRNWYFVVEATSDLDVKLDTPESYYRKIKDYLEQKRLKFREDQDFFSTFEEYVYWCMEKNEIYFDELGRVDTVRSQNPINVIKIELNEYNSRAKEAGYPTFPINGFDDVIVKIAYDIRKKKEDEVRELLKFDPAASDKGFTKVVDQMIPYSDIKKPLHAEALKHLMWQVKRKMLGMQILDPLMLYISGKQGQGKSSIIRHLFHKPLGHFYTEQDLADALDVRSADTKRYHYFVLIDEMVNLNKTMVANLKKILTSKEESSRVLGTNSVMLVKNNLTFAATSNYDLTTTIYDETGLRRFWEIRFGLEAGQVIDWDELEKVDVIEMWRSVDENREYGYYHRSLPTYAAMKAHQDESIPKSYAHLFLYSQHYLVDTAENYAWLKVGDLFNAYKTWAKERDVKNSAHNIVWFENKLQSMGVQYREFERDRAYYLNNHSGSSAEAIKSDEVPETAPVTMAGPKSSRLIRKDNVKKFQKDANIPFKEVE